VAKASSMLYSESCNPEPGWALELAGVDLEVSRSTLSSPTAGAALISCRLTG
jgi:hypothetical protein